MSKDAQANRNAPIDPEWVATITREVIARLLTGKITSPKTSSPTSNSPNTETAKTNVPAVAIPDRVITFDTLEQLTTTATRLSIAPGAIVTPAARDEARNRGLTFEKATGTPPTQPADHARQLDIVDTANPEREATVRAQVARRGLAGSARILLTDAPARDVYQQIAQRREIAVMITSLNDIQRSVSEDLLPTVWVLDMKRLNIPAAVNVIAEIARIGNV